MKICDVKTYVMASPNRDYVFVKVTTDEGLYGWGEGTLERKERTVATAVEDLKPFLLHWNEFLEPLVYLSSLEKYTLALGLRFFQTQPNDAQEPRDQLLMAASLTMTAPVLLLFFACQRYFIRGIVMSGIKG